MRLDQGVIRELHWHKEAEWAYVLEGHVRITALDLDGGYFMDDLEKGDLWYFPPGYPHSLQGLSPNGSEFLLIFDDGNFSEESTFLLTDWFGKCVYVPVTWSMVVNGGLHEMCQTRCGPYCRRGCPLLRQETIAV